VEPVNAREGKLTIGAGVAAMMSGIALQAFTVQSVANQAPPQFGSNTSSATLISTIAGLLILSGIVLTIVGVIRYAQSGGGRVQPLPEHTGAIQTAPDAIAGMSSGSASTAAFCSTCGAGVVGEGRFCASCGASITR
jgi:hypothetical protein